MLLSKLLEEVEFLECKNFTERDITDVSPSSKECKEGCVFVCIKGERYDGNDFVDDAASRGAKVFVSERDLSTKRDETVIISKNARKTLAEISKCLHFRNIENMLIVGITGTKGKTTTAVCLSEALKNSGVPVIFIGTPGIKIFGNEGGYTDTDNTTPDAPLIYKSLSLAYNLGIRAAVIEVSSQALAKYRVYGIPFTLGIFTNFSSDHIGASEHKDEQEYFMAKKSLFDSYGVRCAVVNIQDSRALEISSAVPEIITVKTTLLQGGNLNLRFLCNGEMIKLLGVGAFNAVNASLALAAAERMFGITKTSLAEALGSVFVNGRFEVYRIRGKTVIIDYAHNAESFRAVMCEVRKFTKGKIISVFGSVGDRGADRRIALAKAAERFSDLSVITTDNPGFESPTKIAEDIYSGFTVKERARVLVDRIEAIAYAVSFATSRDTVLLLGKGHEKYQLVNGEKRLFSERAILLALGAKPICSF